MSRRMYRGDPKAQRRPHKKIQKRYEERAVVLDILTSENVRRRDIAKGESRLQVVGNTWFTLLEVSPKEETKFLVLESITLNKEDAESKVEKIVSRIDFGKLSTIGKRGLETAIETILTQEEKRFITWINQAGPISIRLHKLQLIKGIGPKFMNEILYERKDLPFISYEDFEERIKIKDIKSLLKQRILEEIKEDNIKYHLFTRMNRRT